MAITKKERDFLDGWTATQVQVIANGGPDANVALQSLKRAVAETSEESLRTIASDHMARVRSSLVSLNAAETDNIAVRAAEIEKIDAPDPEK